MSPQLAKFVGQPDRTTPSKNRLVNSRFAYVSVSCPSHDAVVFTDDVAKLVPQLGADVSKTSALEINPASSIAQGIGLGLSRPELM